MEVCRHAYPPVKDLGKGHEVACWLYADEAEKTQALKEANGEEKAT
jgi:oligopeptide transport system ATP-binding protein